MKNKSFLVLVTVCSTIFLWILYLNFFESDAVDYHFFDRNITSNNNLIFEKLVDKFSKNEYIDDIPSNDSIIELEKKVIDTNNVDYKLYISDFGFRNKSLKTAKMPNGCNVLFYKNNQIYFTKKFKLFSCDLKTNSIVNYPLVNMKISVIKFLHNSFDEIMVFGEQQKDNKFLSGFFKISLKTLKINPVKIIETNNDSKFLSNSLKYVGEFTYSKTDSILSYACDKYSRVFFFSIKGEFKKVLLTKDESPIPLILTNENGDSFYGRGTYNTNTACFVKNGFIYVFSARAKNKLDLIIDRYSYNNLKYDKSYKIKCKNYCSKDITNLFIDVNGIILSFTTNYVSLKFSR